MQGTPTDFRLYHSNALEVLAGLLSMELQKPVPGQPLLTPDTILIPQPAMRRWLQATLAKRHGIAANLEFLTPGEFVTRALNANLGKPARELTTETLRWKLHAALTDTAFLARPGMASMAGYLAADDPLRAWSLAGELAGVFEKYQAWRRDWLLAWDAGADARDPQAMLWRAATAGQDHRAARIDRYIRRFFDGAELPQGLPARMFAFGTLNVSPDVLKIIASQARTGTLHFHLPVPTGKAWGDLPAFASRASRMADALDDGEQGNPLLRDWGAAGRDFLALLGSYEVVHPSGEIDASVDPQQARKTKTARKQQRTLAEGGLQDSLLRRMQGDVFHDRPSPPLEPNADDTRERLPALRREDPSLQFHACHTRLRELQVLHDRLRSLLEPDSAEGSRFDPPLQPREIAVLAPDIDVYAPYLDAVFGGRGRDDAIPYTIADASPLAGEPLAEVFLRLLALPLSRFGLEEVLDLLASPPLAEAAGLQPVDIDRVRSWLHEAGARWGIDAAHRVRHGAPDDGTHTWQFALDRLLLGHASGEDGEIDGVATLADLEGGALEALDRVLRQLRVLAQYQSSLGQAATPAKWRERLLALLDALWPRPPADTRGQRALERLRKLIDAFAEDAARADFNALVQPEIVRSHFTAALSEADTRAPLLTGGVSFARMVPMRLLPFRVICLLGMNDGEFPRRDPAAGLNKLAATIGTRERRTGDRSTRDDDRYLFLQLFAAAQDVFSVSWLGADPRDGSAREPSALVTELLAAASQWHANPADAARELVLQHPLQPFSPAAFGGKDARRFSYHGAWQATAAGLSGDREALAPWIAADASLDAVSEVEAELSLGALRRFFQHPARQFLQQRLDMRLPERRDITDDIEPLQLPGHGLERHALRRAVFDARLAGATSSRMLSQLRARGLLPAGATGLRALEQVQAEMEPHVQRFAEWRGSAEADSVLLDTSVEGVRLHERLREVFPQGVARLQFGRPSGGATLRNGLDWLLATAAGVSLPFVEFFENEYGEVVVSERPPVPAEQARNALAVLMQLRRDGLRRPLPFAPYSSWKLFNHPSPVRGLQEAVQSWRGRVGSDWAEGANDAWQIALRGRDPFVDEASREEFASLAGTVFGAVTSAAYLSIDVAGIDVPDAGDAEEGE